MAFLLFYPFCDPQVYCGERYPACPLLGQFSQPLPRKIQQLGFWPTCDQNVGNHGLYGPKRILNYFMNICWSYLGLGESWIIPPNSVWVPRFNFYVVSFCVLCFWKGWILRGNWNFEILGDLLGKGTGSGQREEERRGTGGDRSEGQGMRGSWKTRQVTGPGAASLLCSCLLCESAHWLYLKDLLAKHFLNKNFIWSPHIPIEKWCLLGLWFLSPFFS